MTLHASRLILHADDFGLNEAVTVGIVRGFRDGLLTSTSALSNAPDIGRSLDRWKDLLAEQAADAIPSRLQRKMLDDVQRPFDLGVHLNLTQGRPLTGERYPAELLDVNGCFPGVFALFFRLQRGGRRFLPGVETELDRQVQTVCDHGLRPTHLNGHQYIEMIPGVTEIVFRLADRYSISVMRAAREPSLARNTIWRGQIVRWPLSCVKRAFAERFVKQLDSRGIHHPDAFFGTAHAGEIDLSLLTRFLASVGQHCTVEVGLHPSETAEAESAEARTNGWSDPLAERRPRELQMLTSSDLVKFLDQTGWRLGRLAKP